VPTALEFGNWVADARLPETHRFLHEPSALGLRCFHSFFKSMLVTHRAANPHHSQEDVVS